MPKRKMKFINGIMMPDTDAPVSERAKIQTDPLNVSKDQLPVISTQKELEDITVAHNVPTAKSVQATILLVQDEGYNADLNLSEDADVLEELGNQLAASNTPIGIMNKYISAQYVHRLYLVDNSGSMGSSLRLKDKDGNINPLVLLKNAHAEILKRHRPIHSQENNETMSRYEEAEHKIHVAIDDMKNIPTGEWRFVFFNNGSSLDFTINREGKTPEQFATEAHTKVSQAFAHPPTQATPLRRTIEKAFDAHKALAAKELIADPEAQTKTHITILTDGDPSPDRQYRDNADFLRATDEAIERVIEVIKLRPEPMNTPIHVWICGEEVKWTDRLDGDCKNVAVIDDYRSELLQVREKQGIRFPYTPGLHNACASLAADDDNKNDLDMVDENVPFTKMQLDNLLGYVMTLETYRDYWIHNMNAAVYDKDYAAFSGEPCIQRVLVPEREQKRLEQLVGYDRNGDAPAGLRSGSYEDKVRFVQTCLASSAPKPQGPGSNSIFSFGAAINAFASADANTPSYKY